MGLFGKDAYSEQLLDEIQGLRKQIAELLGKREALNDELKLQGTVKQLRKEVEKLEIEKDRIIEDNDRQEREVRHEVGLLRKQVETERELATKEAVLKVREENLQADRDRFEEQMKFTTDRFEKEVTYLHEIATAMLQRLPTVNVNKEIVEETHRGTNGRRAKPKVEA